MSSESAKAFVEKMRADRKFNGRVTAAKDKEARTTLVKSEGFDFTRDELNLVFSEWDQWVEWFGIDGMALENIFGTIKLF